MFSNLRLSNATTRTNSSSSSRRVGAEDMRMPAAHTLKAAATRELKEMDGVGAAAAREAAAAGSRRLG
jgi:hypothetical protein